MKKSAVITCILLAIAFISNAKAQSLDDILKNHFKAVGQKKLADVNTVVTTGSINQSGIEIPFTQTTMRPDKLRIEGTFQNLTFVQTFNGTEGWVVNPFAGSTEAQPIPADQLKELKLQADIDGMLYNWQDKGYTVTLDSTEDVEGTPCYKIRVVTKDNETYIHFIDMDSYLLIKTWSKINIGGVEVEAEAYFSNYMQVDGITFPGKIENRQNGVTGEMITITKVELNPVLDPKIFDKPVTN